MCTSCTVRVSGVHVLRLGLKTPKVSVTHHQDYFAVVSGVSAGLASVVADDVATWLGKLVGGMVVGIVTGLIVKWLDRKLWAKTKGED